jgi:uncharacterized lipoprotein YddW (UPF0748 family)
MIEAQTAPKREFRGAWVATVTNIDWPSLPGLPVDVQKTQLTTILDNLKALGINAVFLQVRSECDAMYNSLYDPWSYWLTGTQGTAPSPFYDPLAFAVDEAHKRGMELHAWFNPYRAVRNVSGTYPISGQHVTKQHPDWILTINNLKILHPGLQAVRDYVTSVVMDIARRYDVDGVHADDYFYPYSPDNITTQDNATFASYPRGFSNIADWRRDNVNLLIKAIHDSLQVIKPWVRFGMAPFGIWKPGYPAGITGTSAYDELYCDAPTWLASHWIDYLAPELYWHIGGAQDYAGLMHWWASRLSGRHLYPGHAAYRIGTTQTNPTYYWNSSELPNQVRLNRAYADSNVLGSVFYRAGNGLTDNLLGFADTLKNNLYRFAAIPPSMPWKDNVAPNPPANLHFATLPGTSRYALQWDPPVVASDGDTARRYVVYRFNHGSVLPSDIADPSGIITITPGTSNTPPTPIQPGAYFVVTSLDRTNNESNISNVSYVAPPLSVVLAGPANGVTTLRDTAFLSWKPAQFASSYFVQVSQDTSFQVLALSAGITDTTVFIAGLTGQVPYYWRVRSLNPGGPGPLSPVWTFQSSKPSTPLLAGPEDHLPNVPVTVALSWNRAQSAASYNIQVSLDLNWTSFVLDTVGVKDTTLLVANLGYYKIYHWRVRAANTFGISDWSPAFTFRTVTATAVENNGQVPAAFDLAQNYPNPFNPTTTIRFAVPQSGQVSLRVYDLLGREVAVLVDGPLTPGYYAARFDGHALSSGIYFYRLVASGFVETRKMQLIK